MKKTSETPRTAISFVRFSSSSQERGDSLRRQTTIAQEVADQKGWDLAEGIFARGVSGYSGKAISHYLDKLATDTPEGSVIIVEKTDRLGRLKPTKALAKLQAILATGRTVYIEQNRKEYSEDSLDDDFSELLMILFQAFVAHEESKKKSDRAKANWEKIRQEALQGAQNIYSKTGRTIYGYRVNEGKQTANEVEAKVVKRIFAMAEEGNAPTRIARLLNEDGIKSSTGKPWGYQSIQRILTNPGYTGKRVFYNLIDGKRIPTATVDNYYPPLIPESVFSKIQKKLHSRLIAAQRTASKSSNLFSGFFYCSDCGNTVTVFPSRSVQYKCTHNRQAMGCRSGSVPARLFEIGVINALSEHLHPERIIQDIRQRNEAAHFTDQRETVRSRIRSLSKEIDNAEENFFSLDKVPPSLLSKLESKRKELSKLTGDLETLDLRIEAATAEYSETVQIAKSFYSLACQAILGELGQGFAFFETSEQLDEFLKFLNANAPRDLETARIKLRSAIEKVVEKVSFDTKTKEALITLRTGGLVRADYFRGSWAKQYFQHPHKNRIEVSQYRLQSAESKTPLLSSSLGFLLILNNDTQNLSKSTSWFDHLSRDEQEFVKAQFIVDRHEAGIQKYAEAEIERVAKLVLELGKSLAAQRK